MSLQRCLLLLLLAGACAGQVQSVNGTVRLEVGCTAGCPHVARYISQVLGPAYEKYRQFLRVEFVPWGRTTRVNGALECQFGVRDCWANRLYRCVLNMLQSNQDAMVRYMVCEFSSPQPGYAGSYACVQQTGLRLLEVDHCMATATGTALEAPAEAAAAEPMRIINGIPYTVINGVIDSPTSVQASRRLDSLICFALADDASTGVTACKIDSSL